MVEGKLGNSRSVNQQKKPVLNSYALTAPIDATLEAPDKPSLLLLKMTFLEGFKEAYIERGRLVPIEARNPLWMLILQRLKKGEPIRLHPLVGDHPLTKNS